MKWQKCFHEIKKKFQLYARAYVEYGRYAPDMLSQSDVI